VSWNLRGHRERTRQRVLHQGPADLARAGAREKKARLKNLYHRLLTEAASSGLTERELLSFMKERNI